ncbi:MAG: sugar phosphate isomerase/epimerase family protein [Bacteroidota bacterium]
MQRRKVLGQLALTPLILNSGFKFKPTIQDRRLQFSVNAYSFNQQLRDGQMNFDDMMEYAADIGLNAVDLTGYYFKSYPEIPDDKELFRLKKKALRLGLNISWTGVRNDFTVPDREARNADIEFIKNWLIVSQKLGATIMRIYAGRGDYTGYSKDQVKKWMAEDFKVCAEFAQKTGVIAALQHHNNFLFKADEVIDMIERVDSEWFGLILDVGSLDDPDPYSEIEKLAPYADYWFVKEHVTQNGKRVPVNMDKIATILKKSDYRGYISFESLSPDGDPKEIVKDMFSSFKKAYEKA